MSTDETREMAALHNYISMLLVDRADLVDALKRVNDEHDATYAELRTARLSMDALARGEGIKHLNDQVAVLRDQVARLASRLDKCKKRLKVSEESAHELLGRVVTADTALEEAIADANVLAAYISKGRAEQRRHPQPPPPGAQHLREPGDRRIQPRSPAHDGW